MLRLNFGYKEAEKKKIGGRTERTQGESEGGVTSSRCRPTGIKRKSAPCHAPLSCGYFRDLPIQYWCSEWVKFLQAQSTSTFLRENRNNNTSTMYKKILLKGKYFLWPPPQDPPTQTPLPSLVLELFLLCYFAFIFLTGGGLDVLLLEGVWGCRGTHIKRDDNIVFMDQGSCISFSKGTFFSIPFLY